MILPGDMVRGDSIEKCWLFVKPDANTVPYPNPLASDEIAVVIGRLPQSIWLVVYAHQLIAYALPDRVIVVRHAISVDQLLAKHRRKKMT